MGIVFFCPFVVSIMLGDNGVDYLVRIREFGHVGADIRRLTLFEF